MEILDVGCGDARDPRATEGIDIRAYPGVTIVHDLEHFPWPIASNRFDRLILRDALEHFDNVVATMEELHRIAKSGGRIEIWTPHYSHPNSYNDPTHKHHFSFGTLDYFTGDRAYPRYLNCRFRMAEKRLIFDKHEWCGKLLARLSTRRYERYHCHRFPSRGMYFELEVMK
ncbi:MAG: methyltransferase domain-containing protein [Candidatus Omnitrophica bacterium]|nr:methyltransferase domain-containing protein [Candidatus Omnitrophota bacterium]